MPSRCTLPIPAFALTLDPSGRRDRVTVSFLLVEQPMVQREAVEHEKLLLDLL